MKEPALSTPDPSNELHAALRGYFESGGPACYIAPLDHLEQALRALSNTRLAVAAGQNLLKRVAELAASFPRVFFLLDAPQDLQSEDSLPITPAAAAYYPWLSADWAQTSIPPTSVVAAYICIADAWSGPWELHPFRTRGRPKCKLEVPDAGEMARATRCNIMRKTPNLQWGPRTLEPNMPVTCSRTQVLIRSFCQDQLATIPAGAGAGACGKLAAAVNDYLFSIWTSGGLYGSVAEEAYAVSAWEKKEGEGESEGSVLRLRLKLVLRRLGQFEEVEMTRRLEKQ